MHGIPPPGFRLPESSHVGAVRLQVRDLERSIDYYERVIGLRTTVREGDMAGLSAGGNARPLVWLHAKPGIDAVPRRGAFGLYHFALLLPDRKSLGHFVGHLFDLKIRFGSADHLVSEALYLTDPDGLGIEVYADRPHEGWKYSGDELVMTTEPLALVGNLDLPGRGWTAAPAGTVIGHVHLHVGSLEQADTFYHRGLGFDKTVWSYPGALFFAAGTYHHHLGTNTWSPGPAATDEQARLLDWELVISDEGAVEAALRSLHDAGFSGVDGQPATMRPDPWGTRVRLIAEGPRGTASL